jgi:hypothetical protein
MSCYISSGHTLDCRNASTGGVKALWVLGGSGSTIGITGTTSTQNGGITAISGQGTFFKYELVKQSSSFSEELQVNETAQSVVFAPSLVVTLPKLNQTLRTKWFDLIKPNDLVIIIEDNNGRYWLVGEENGLTVSAGSMLMGQAYNDPNGVTFTMSGGEPNPSMEIVVTTTLAAVMTGITVDSE